MKTCPEQDLPNGLCGFCRINLFGSIKVVRGRGKRAKTVTLACAIQAWNSDSKAEFRMSRLEGSGSFYWFGAINATLAAKRLLAASPNFTQAQIETISGREIARIYKLTD